MDGNVTKIKKAGAFTTFKYNHIELSWTVEDWKLSKTLNKNKSLVSPVFKIDGYEWSIELLTFLRQTTTKNGDVANEGLFAQIHLKLKAPDSTPIFVDGSVTIDEVLDLELSGSLGRQQQTAPVQYDAIGEPIYRHSNRPPDTCNYIKTRKEELPSSTGDTLKLVVNFKFSPGEPKSHVTETVSKTFRKAFVNDSPSQEDDLAEDLGMLLINQKDCDMTIIIKDAAIAGHGLIFAARSPVVKEMLEEAGNKGKPLKFKVECSSVRVWKEFQRFIYTGKTSIGDLELLTFADELFRLGKKFKVTAISRYLTTRLTSIMSHRNILDVLEIAYQNDAPQLKGAGTKILMDNLAAVKSNQQEKLVSFVQSHADIAALIIQR